MKTILLFIIALFLPSIINANIKNFFIEIKKDQVIIGQYLKDGRQKSFLQKQSADHLDFKEVEQILNIDSDDKILYYFHSMWGAFPPYHNHTIKKLNNLEGVNKTISIVWHADKISYKALWHSSFYQGQKVGHLFNYLTQSDKTQANFVICHSMGHRIFEGIMSRNNDSSIRFDKVIFAAADLDVTVFEQHLKLLPAISNKIVVYIHKKDRLLKISRKSHKRDRLGLNADEYLDQLSTIKNLEIIDLSNTGGRFSLNKHKYFKSHKTVFMDIYWLISNQEEKRNFNLIQKSQNLYCLQ